MSQDCCAALVTYNYLIFQLKYLQTANKAGGDKIPWGGKRKIIQMKTASIVN